MDKHYFAKIIFVWSRSDHCVRAYFIVTIGLYDRTRNEARCVTDDLTMPAIKFLRSVERTFLESTMSRDIAFLIYANCATCVIRLLKCSPYRYRFTPRSCSQIFQLVRMVKNSSIRINIGRNYHRRDLATSSRR